MDCRFGLIWAEPNALIFFLCAEQLHATADPVRASMAAASFEPMRFCEKPAPRANMPERFDGCMLSVDNEAKPCHKILPDPWFAKDHLFLLKKIL